MDFVFFIDVFFLFVKANTLCLERICSFISFRHITVAGPGNCCSDGTDETTRDGVMT